MQLCSLIGAGKGDIMVNDAIFQSELAPLLGLLSHKITLYGGNTFQAPLVPLLTLATNTLYISTIRCIQFCSWGLRIHKALVWSMMLLFSKKLLSHKVILNGGNNTGEAPQYQHSQPYLPSF